MINTAEVIRETPQSPLDWYCANCLRDHASLNEHGRCPQCNSNAVRQFPIKSTLEKENQ